MRRRKFIPPIRVAARKVEVKTEPVELVDQNEAIIALEEEEEDIKPSANELQRGIAERKRKRSQTPEGREI
jgi:hypothetical protein